MSDFFQPGGIATLHRLGEPDVPRLERELAAFVREMPVALVLPCHVSEIGTPALRGIIRELGAVKFLRQVVVGIDGAKTREDWARAKKAFAGLPQKPALLWNDGPRIRSLLRGLRGAELDAGPGGKGRNVWLCFGYVLASERARVVAVHDCDILTYSRELLARLCYPVLHPGLGFDFCKGYYARVTGRLNGRVTRLLVAPLIRALRAAAGPHPFLEYMDTFRYPLAGEVCLGADLARRVRVPCDWSLEVGVLAEVFRNSALRAICQSELCANYDHKHRDLSPRDADKGLGRMAADIARSFFRRMVAEGVRLDAGLLDTVLAAYQREAEESLRFYRADAAINGLEFPRREEERGVKTFLRGIRDASRAFLGDPLDLPLIPSWERVESARPGVLAELAGSVEADGR